MHHTHFMGRKLSRIFAFTTPLPFFMLRVSGLSLFPSEI